MCLSGPPGEPGGTSQTLHISEDPDGRGDPPGREGLAATAKERRPTILLPKKGREKLASLLADLMGLSAATARPHRRSRDSSCAPGLYESMSSVLGPGSERDPRRTSCVGVPSPTTPPRGAAAAIYENCLKCIGDHCHPPLRFPSAQGLNASTTSLDAGVGPLGSLGPLRSLGPLGSLGPLRSPGPLASSGPLPRGGGATTEAMAPPPRGLRHLHAHACGASLGGEHRHDDVTPGTSVAIEGKNLGRPPRQRHRHPEPSARTCFVPGAAGIRQD